MEIIQTENAPAAIGPYSQAVVAGNLIFASGQLGLDPATGAFAGDTIEEQAAQALKNVAALLESVGLGLDNVVKTTCYLNDMGSFVRFNQVYAEYFTANLPARSVVGVQALPKDALIEVEVVALRP